MEVRQSGVLIHTSLVPAGPFTLTDVKMLNGRTDLDVTVIEANGEEHRFSIAAASLSRANLSAPGFSMAAGKVRTFDNSDMQAPMVMTASDGWTLQDNHVLAAGAMVSDNAYRAVGGTLDSQLTPRTTSSLRGAFANAGEEGVNGAQASVAVNTRLGEQFSLGLNYTRNTEGYRDLLDTAYAYESDYFKGRSKAEYGISVGWFNPLLGSFSTGYSNFERFDGGSSKRLSASWSKTFDQASVNFNLSRDLGGRQAHRAPDGKYRRYLQAEDTAMYLSISVPLEGRRSMRTYANKRDGRTRMGASFDNYSGDFAKYRLSTDRDLENRQQNFAANVNLTPRFAQVGLGYAKNGTVSTSYNGQLRGGVAMHGDGLTLSPHPLADTFGIAKVGDVAGVKLSTPAGPVWTDGSGNAVIPRLSAYGNSRVEIETKTLPRNVDLKNGSKSLAVGRGSVSQLDFAVIKSRRALLVVSDADAQPVKKGASVLDSQGKFVTTVGDGGKVFIANGHLDDSLSIDLGEGRSCALDYNLPEEPDLEVYYETAKATCVTG